MWLALGVDYERDHNALGDVVRIASDEVLAARGFEKRVAGL